MLTSTKSIDTPGNSAKEQMHMQIQLQQQQPVQHTIIFVEGDGPEPVPKLKEPSCCGCNLTTASIIAMIIHGLITLDEIRPRRLEGLQKEYGDYYYVSPIFFGGMTLCYAGIVFCRTEQLCSIVAAVIHLLSIPIYLIAVYLFFLAACGFYYSGTKRSERPVELGEYNLYQIPLFFGVFFTLMGGLNTYMANKYQEFGEYLNKENKQ